MKRKFCFLTSLCLAMLLAACAAGQGSRGIPTQPLNGDSVSIAQQQAPSPVIANPRQLVTTSPTPAQIHLPSIGTGASPYGPPPPLTAEELQLTQQLFNLINHGRAVRGLYPFVWNAALAGLSNPPWTQMYVVQESMVSEPPGSWHRIHLTNTTLHRIGVGLFIDPHGWVWFTQDLLSQIAVCQQIATRIKHWMSPASPTDTIEPSAALNPFRREPKKRRGERRIALFGCY